MTSGGGELGLAASPNKMTVSVTLAMRLRQFEFEFDPDFTKEKIDIMEHPKHLNHPVGMRTGAIIHTRNGLHMLVKMRDIGAALCSFSLNQLLIQRRLDLLCYPDQKS